VCHDRDFVIEPINVSVLGLALKEGRMRKFQPATNFLQSKMPLVSLRGNPARVRGRGTIAFRTVCFAIFVLPASSVAQTNHRAQRSHLELRSSDTRLVQSFNWAKQQAMAYVFDGDPVGPWFEAALPGRRAFCMRDVSHQVAGAQALGLSKYTHNMLRRFAENISASKAWCSYWEINYLNRPAPIDFKSDDAFWYNLPANFDVLDACYRMYLWTGDRTYIDDPVFLNFYAHSVTDYVSQWDLGMDRIMARKNPEQTPPFFRGDPSYEESRRDMVLGLDLLATQYAGYRSYAAIRAIQGDEEAAQMYLRSASEVRRLINTTWWNPNGSYFYAFLDSDHQFQGRAGADLLYRDVADDGPKAQSALDGVLKKMRDEPASEVEPESHYAEILYRYGEPEAAYAEIMDLTHPGRERQEYPEVSYSAIGAIVIGLMGINVEPAVPIDDIARRKHFETVVRTLPQLTTRTSWAELRNVPIGDGSITVRHFGERKSILVNHEEKDLNWEAAFPGSFATLVVNGQSINAHTQSRHFGRAETWVRIKVKPGRSARVEIPE
jgi:hypothetical protein